MLLLDACARRAKGLLTRGNLVSAAAATLATCRRLLDQQTPVTKETFLRPRQWPRRLRLLLARHVIPAAPSLEGGGIAGRLLAASLVDDAEFWTRQVVASPESTTTGEEKEESGADDGPPAWATAAAYAQVLVRAGNLPGALAALLDCQTHLLAIQPDCCST